MDRKAMTATEIAVKGEERHQVLDRGAIRTLLTEGNVAGMFKYALHERSLPSSIGEPERVFEVGEVGGVLLDSRPKAESVISSSSPDRDGDIMIQRGLVITDNYTLNPTVFGMHMHSIPVGFSELLKQFPALTWARWQWLNDVAQSEGADYAEMWEKHVLNCTSVGFLINHWEPVDGDDFWGGWKIKEWELLEHSPVSLPANREALRTDGLKSLFRKYVESVYEGPSPVLRKWFEEIEQKGAPLTIPVNIQVSVTKAEDTPLASSSAGVGGSQGAKKDEQEDESEKQWTFENIRLAAAAGVIPVDEAFERIEKLIDVAKGAIAELEGALAVAQQTNGDLALRLTELSAEVVDTLG